MPQYTQEFTEIHEPLDYLTYQVLSPGLHYTPFVDVRAFHRVWAQWYVGNMGPGSYVYVDIVEAPVATGAGWQWMWWYITSADSAAGEQMTHHGFDVRTDRLTDGWHYLALQIYVYVNPIEFTSWIWGVCPRFTAVDQTFWDEIVHN